MKPEEVYEALRANYSDRVKALEIRFADLGLDIPKPEECKFMEEIIAIIQDGISDKDTIEFDADDYMELTKDLYETTLDEDKKIDKRSRAIIDFAVDWLRDILDTFEAKEAEVDKDEDEP
jgi:hypothetical protein